MCSCKREANGRNSQSFLVLQIKLDAVKYLNSLFISLAEKVANFVCYIDSLTLTMYNNSILSSFHDCLFSETIEKQLFKFNLLVSVHLFLFKFFDFKLH